MRCPDVYEREKEAGHWIACEHPERPIEDGGWASSLGIICPRCLIAEIACGVTDPDGVIYIGTESQTLYDLPYVTTNGAVLAAMQRLGVPEALAVRRSGDIIQA